MKPKNTVEINGKLYDAKTGKPVVEERQKTQTAKTSPTPAKKPAAARTATKPVTRKMGNGKYIDGLTRRPATAAKPTVQAKKVTKPVAPPKPKVSATRQSPKRAGLSTKRSTTLNRKIVNAPQIIVSSPIDTEPEKPNVTSSALKWGDEARFKRAQKVSKSTSISRFLPTNQDAVQSKPKNTTDKPALVEKPVDHRASTKEKLVKKAIEGATAKPVQTKATKRTKKRSSKKPLLAKFAAPAAAAFLIASYVAYLNIPSISMRVAANRAGFAASMPTYRPSGYSLNGPIAYNPGQITINFSSNTDNRAFSLTQKPTTWDSTALFENLVAKETENYVTYQDRGLTIYLFGEGQAAWVSGGKLFQIEGQNSQLDTQQILNIASSV